MEADITLDTLCTAVTVDWTDEEGVADWDAVGLLEMDVVCDNDAVVLTVLDIVGETVLTPVDVALALWLLTPVIDPAITNVRVDILDTDDNGEDE